ncbi:MAG TPA: PilZ domain-containing protein [Terriglobales bacterium]|nr:PilZ domain-containing protein [Terriglobales bacterium]
MDDSETRAIATVLIVSPDSIATSQISDVLREHALSVESSDNPSIALHRLQQQKFEAVVVDAALENEAIACLQHTRASPNNRTAVTFALTRSSDDTAAALRHGFSFIFERPLTPESISHTLKVAYGLIVRERRRHFRYPVVVPAVLTRKNTPEVFACTVNISENGVALNSSVALERGSQGTVQFTLPDPSLQITAECKVCWNNQKGFAGLQFLFLPSDLASHLQAWLAQKLEEQLPQLVFEKFRPS